ncbi:M35 family metallo-endopeptidase [Massilia yuzhufengensis]|uniref:Peptidyl-Lys metalloendopeptidase n=1 Tax=Massilia yuzhufengensis TaxID=1164594 RepID=A0A1I1MHW6_9BURK|nr:M35 family metallo-endopeptidase [Massilia yuzhufengensis]SFC85041.1 peptidyl-Lys metalloendopeptidase [Massilia yuzhufengensis]
MPRHLSLSLLLSLPALSALAQDVSVTIAPVREKFARSDEVLVRVTLQNNSAAPQFLLKWHTPLDGVEAPIFEVLRDGQPVRYLGIKAKRPAPGPGDYLRLEPGAAASSTVELSALYEMNVTGPYTLRYRSGSPSLYASPGMRPVAGTLASNPASIWIDGRLPRGARAPAKQAVEGASLDFSKCSNAQQEQLAAAVNAGKAMTVDAHGYLAAAAAGGSYGARYGSWFGASDVGRAATVNTHFTAIRDAFETKPIKIDCGCTASYFAYVYPAQPYTIYVCNAFWTAPLTGTDSRGGTLLHELSHFDIVAATDDHVYGQQGAAELARTDPARAINNADSHEYFGENTPAQQ